MSDYYIVKSAVYIHGIYGPYSSRQEALGAFKAAYDGTTNSFHNNFDGHHEYYLQQGLNEQVGENLNIDNDLIPYEPKRETP